VFCCSVIKILVMENEIKKSNQATADKTNEFDRTPDLDQEESALEDDGTPVLDEQDLEENHISEEEADTIEWEDVDEENSNRQGIDKAPGEERGRSEQVTNKDLKAKQVDADPSTEAGKPLNKQQ